MVACKHVRSCHSDRSCLKTRIYPSCPRHSMAAFVKWYENEHFDPLALSVTQILDYLQSLVAQNNAINIIKGYITAISDRYEKVKLRSKYYSINQLPSMQIWIQGLTLSQHIPRVMIPSWDFDIVLSALQSTRTILSRLLP